MGGRSLQSTNRQWTLNAASLRPAPIASKLSEGEYGFAICGFRIEDRGANDKRMENGDRRLEIALAFWLAELTASTVRDIVAMTLTHETDGVFGPIDTHR